MATYKAYLSTPDRNPGLVEEAEVAVIDLAYELYVKGNRSYLPALESRLKSSDKVVRYYAAFKLSYARDRAAAVNATKTIDDFFVADGKVWLAFAKHVLVCPACLAYEQSRGRML